MKSDLWFGRLGLTLAICLAAWLALSWPWLSGNLTIPYDAKAHFHAQIQFLAHALHTGQSPFWTSNVFGGFPQIADPQSLIFSPAIILALLSAQPTFTMVDAYVLGLLAMGQLAIVMFFRDKNWHPAGAIVAAIAFGFGASAAWRIQHVGQIQSYAFFAITLWLLAGALDRRSIWWGVGAGAAGGLMLAEPDQIALLGAYFLGFYMLAAVFDGRIGWCSVRPYLPLLGAGALTGFLVAAVPLLMTWLFVEQSNRPAVDFAEAARGSLHPASLLTTVIGDLYGALDPKVDYWGPSSIAWNPNELTLSQNMGQVYVGALPILLFLTIGVTRGAAWSREIRVFTIALVFMIVYALGGFTPLFRLIYEIVPGVKLFRRPADATFMIGALLAVIAGYLAHLLATRQAPLAGARQRFIEAGVIAGLLVTGLYLAAKHAHLADAIKPTLIAMAWIAVAACAMLALRRIPLAGGGVALAAVAVFMSADLSANNGPNESTALPVAQFDVLDPSCKNETIRFLKARLKGETDRSRRDRVELVGLGFSWPNLGLIHNFDHLLGYNPLRADVSAKAIGIGDTIAGWEQRQFTPLFPSYRSLLADMVGLRYIATPIPVEMIDKRLKPGDHRQIARTADAYIYENPRALPRVMFVGDWQLADFKDLVESGVWPRFDPTATLLLEQEPPQQLDSKFQLAGTVKPSAAITHFENTVVEIEVNAPKAGFVLMNSAWHPWWRATVDGHPVEILKANVMFRAVQVPAGRHKVRLDFEPLRGALVEISHPAQPASVRRKLTPRRPQI